MYNVGDIFYLDSGYSARANYCNQNELMIVEIEPDENGRRFQIQSIPEPTQEELNNKRKYEIQERLTQLDQDIIQDMAGEIVPDIEEKKAEFVELHNELRELLGKEPRAVKE